MYLALEPFVRRRWPHALIAWNRILGGQFKDPLAGRDILVGVFFAALLAAFRTSLVLMQLKPPTPPEPALIDAIQSTPRAVAFLLQTLFNSVNISLALFFLISFFRAALRKQWLATGAFVILVNVLSNFALSHSLPTISGLAVSSAFAALWLVGVMQYGLPAGISIWFADRIFIAGIMLAPQGWYAGRMYLLLGVLAGVAIYAFRTSVGKQSLFSFDLMSGKD